MRKALLICALVLIPACEVDSKKKITRVTDGAESNSDTEVYVPQPKPDFPQAQNIRPRNFLSCALTDSAENSSGFYEMNCDMSTEAPVSDWEFSVIRNGRETAEPVAKSQESDGAGSTWKVSIQPDLNDEKIEVIANSPSLGARDSIVLEKAELETQRQALEGRLTNLIRGRLVVSANDPSNERCLRMNNNGNSMSIGDCETRELNNGSEINDISAFQMAEGVWVLQATGTGTCINIRTGGGGFFSNPNPRVELIGCSPTLNSANFQGFSVNDFQGRTVNLTEMDESLSYATSFKIQGATENTADICLIQGENDVISAGGCESALMLTIHSDRVFQRSN